MGSEDTQLATRAEALSRVGLAPVPTPWQPDAQAPVTIDRAEVLRYLGYRGQDVDPDLSRRIATVIDTAEGGLAPRGVFATYPIDIDAAAASREPRLCLRGTAIELTGTSIFRHLKDARWACVVACTLGMPSEQRLRLTSSQHPLEGAVLDAACSAFVEDATEALDQHIQALAAQAGCGCVRRFSPGYGDLPLAVQPQIVSTLNATRLIGLTTTATNLLMPTKSVTALIGIFDGQAPEAAPRPGCAGCRLRQDCFFRSRGLTCHTP